LEFNKVYPIAVGYKRRVAALSTKTPQFQTNKTEISYHFNNRLVAIYYLEFSIA
jgi:hypothetical protein